LISVEPWSWSGKNSLTKETLAEAIALGEFDPEIDSFCQATGSLASRATIRWGHEMDDTADRYTWSGLAPETYVKAYRYFVSQCRKSAPRASFMWSPKGEPNAASYYPGDEYVDSVGISVFGLQPYDREELGRDRGFRDAMRERYDRVAGLGKPVVAAEFGFNGDASYLGSGGGNDMLGPGTSAVEAIVLVPTTSDASLAPAAGNPDCALTAGAFRARVDEPNVSREGS
jgi:beta-mannanase